MRYPDFKSIKDWKDFERLCTDLLNAEGFIIESEPYLDRTGSDIIVREEYRSHDPTRSLSVRWKVQCKHYAGSGKRLGRKQVEESLYHFVSTSQSNDGLFFIVDTDYTEPAIEVINQFSKDHPDKKIEFWNQRVLATKLERHKHLLVRYGLSYPEFDLIAQFSDFNKLGPIRTLIISDQSAIAHNLTSGLRSAGFDITYLPFWNYLEPVRLKLMSHSVLQDDFRLIICFLGDSFGTPVPEVLVDTIQRCHNAGNSILFFPFFAWSLEQGFYPPLREIIPVRLKNPKALDLEQDIKNIYGVTRRGDFSFPLEFDLFAEDQYIEIDPKCGQRPFIDGLNSKFGISHTFEYLKVVNGATVALKDKTGNPFVVFNEGGKGKVCYLNTCCHACLSSIPVSSPLEASREVVQLTKNIINWLLDE